MPITFAVLIMIIRKYPSTYGSSTILLVLAHLYWLPLSTKMISNYDIFLGFLAGFQVGFGFIFITIV